MWWFRASSTRAGNGYTHRSSEKTHGKKLINMNNVYVEENEKEMELKIPLKQVSIDRNVASSNMGDAVSARACIHIARIFDDSAATPWPHTLNTL